MKLKELFGKRRLQPIYDMAVEQDYFDDKCFSLSPQVYTNMAKICLYNDYGLQKHWVKEMVAALTPVMQAKIKTDKSKSQYKKREVFVKAFITSYLGVGYEEYDYPTMKNFFVAAITDEGDKIGHFDIEGTVNVCKECFVKYLDKLKKIDFDNYYTELWQYGLEFVNDVRQAKGLIRYA